MTTFVSEINLFDMRKIFLVLMIIVLAFNTYSQSWQPLLGGLDWQTRTLFADTISGKLFVGGGFDNANGQITHGLAAWTGSSWDTAYGLGSYCEHQSLQISRFQNELYTLGSFTFSRNNSQIIAGFSKWSGTVWDSLDIAFHSLGGCSNGSPAHGCEFNNKFYIVGNFDSVDVYLSSGVVGWDGTNWIPNGIPNYLSSQNGSPGSCVVFQNELYVAGNFGDSLGNLVGCIKFDGTNWTEVGTGGGGLVQTMAVYNNELYIAGGWIGGNNAIVKYDGTNFSTVGGGINAQIFNLKVIDNKLFAVGTFDSAGGIPANRIAMWDGNSWSAFSNDIFDNGINDIAVFQSQIYVTGAFTTINSDTGFNNIAKYNGYTVGENMIPQKSRVSLYPNPTTGTFTLTYNSVRAQNFVPLQLLIYDVLGQEVYTQAIINPNQTTINVSQLSNGVYFYEFDSTGSSTSMRGKFVKE
jgi:hypothetical protein